MIANPYRGEVVVSLDGEPHLVRFSWHAIAALQARYGQGFAATVSQALASYDVATMAEVLAIGLAERHPEMTADKIMASSPPMVTVAAKVTEALNLAFHGPQGLGTEDRETKANPQPARWRTWWRKLSRRLPWQAFSRANFGS
ncbi:GTA-gp10 family protein [Rhodoligotrophos defluvii]|uniref:GTA-gp10 family protein n=1 Tax=Rhodoligotrophos defluvii TaxID=2561934 RepID=UPI0010CA1A0E|nr:GTA-gp10 family protein [Rhodoligotrophos defluvii]